MEDLKQKWNELPVAARAGILGATAVIAVVMVWKVLPAILATMGIVAFIALLFVPYWAPTIVAFVRKHPSKLGILAVNFFFGWTFFGWVISLVWALSNNGSTSGQTVVINNNLGMPAQQYAGQQYAGQQFTAQQVTAPQQVAPAPPQYAIGDVVNGHRFDGVAWQPLPAAAPPAAVAAAPLPAPVETAPSDQTPA